MNKLTSETQVAIQAFEESLKASDLAERKEAALLRAVHRIPADDLPEYVRITEELREKQERKREAKAGQYRVPTLVRR